MKQLVYLSPVPWKSFAQRPHKFVEWFHKTTQGNVLWVDHYPTRFPKFSDIQRLFKKHSLENDQNPNWLKVVPVSALPIEPLPGSGMLNGFLWNSAMQEISNFIQQGSALIVMGQPSVLGLSVLKKHPDILSVYDAMDDFPSFYSGLSSLAMRWREKKVISQVSQLLVSSTALQKRWSSVRKDLKLVPNALDASVLPVPKEPKHSQANKILGYVGTMGQWFDWDWIINLARIRSNDILKLIGPLFVPPPSALPTNIQILPACTHQEALLAMLSFDVGLIPFKNNQLTTSVDPIKYYEYRALGLPMVSTTFGEMAFRTHEEGIFLSNGLEDLNECVETALEYSPNQAHIQKFKEKNTWDSRFTNAKIF